MTYDGARKLMWGAAAVAAVGTVMPWATIFIVSVNGLDTDWGKVAIAFILIGAALGFVRGAWWLQAICPLLVLGTCAWWIQHLSAVDTGKPNALIPINVSTGSGVYVTILGSVVWLGLAIAARRVTVDAVPAAPATAVGPTLAAAVTPSDSAETADPTVTHPTQTE